MTTTRVLVAASLLKPTRILELFLASLVRLEHAAPSIEVSFALVDDLADDGDLPASLALVDRFASERERCTVARAPTLPGLAGRQASSDRSWNPARIDHVCRVKDSFLDAGRAGGFDACFLVDADLLLHPLHVAELLAVQKDIVAAVVWTWLPAPDGTMLPWPNVWCLPNLFPMGFLDRLHERGLFPVDGVSACTLVTRKALAKGASFAPFPSDPRAATGSDDDRFNARARALGLELWVDTTLRVFHVYTSDDVEKGRAFLQSTEEKQR